MNVYYDKLPTEREYTAHKDDMGYSSGKLVAGITSEEGYYYEDIKTIECYKCSQTDTEFDIWFDLGKEFDSPGVYTITVWVENSAGEIIPASSVISVNEA